MASAQVTDTEEDAQSSSATHTRPGRRSRVGTIWVALSCAVLVLILLIIFILQNNVNVKIHFLGLHGNIAFGIAMLIAAVAGSALTLLIGSIRIVQLKLAKRNFS